MDQLKLTSLIIDRVGKTNIFNVIKGRSNNNEGHLHSRLDEDLILEFLGEIERLYRLSHTYAAREHSVAGGSEAAEPPSLPPDSLNILNQLRVTGETFFEQFFPEIIQKKIRHSDGSHLFLDLDSSLANIPWEILHDGSMFLGDKFSLGKSFKGLTDYIENTESPRLTMLILADPTEELEWARREGEELYERLTSTIPTDKLEIEYLGGSQISKLRLLNAIKGKDIIHYCGHLHYSLTEPDDNGWELFGHKVLHAREIQKSGAKPKLVFSNSCLSKKIKRADDLGPDPSSDIAASFLASGIMNYIGTHWEIPDNRRTLGFAAEFYEQLFSGETIGDSLLAARNFARRNFSQNDLTWANYTLYGNPMVRIYKELDGKFNVASNLLNSHIVMNKFPTPLAVAWHHFSEHNGKSPEQDIENLYTLLENIILFYGSIVFSICSENNVKTRKEFRDGKKVNLEEWLNLVYEGMYDLQALRANIALPDVLQCLYVHRDSIYKLIRWRAKFSGDRFEKSTLETYHVTFQYLLENLLIDSYFLENFQLFYVFPDEKEHLLFQGLETRRQSIALPETEDLDLESRIARSQGDLILFDPVKKSLLNISGFMGFEFGAGGRGRFDYPYFADNRFTWPVKSAPDEGSNRKPDTSSGNRKRREK